MDKAMKKCTFSIYLIFSCLCNTFAQNSESIDLKKGKLIHYRFDFDLLDDTKIMNDIEPQDIEFGKNLEDTDSAAVHLNDNKLIANLKKTIYSPDYTVTFWFKTDEDLDENSKKTQIIDWVKTNNRDGIINLYYENGAMNTVVDYGDQNGEGSVEATKYTVRLNFEKGTWHFVAFSFSEKSDFTMTVDNTPPRKIKNLNLKNLKFRRFNNPLVIGANATTKDPKNMNYFHGYLDDFRLYNRILSNDEKEKLFINKTYDFEKPEVKWEFPNTLIEEVYTNKIKVKNCIETYYNLTELKIYINGKLYKTQNKFPEIKNGNGCNYLLENELLLLAGENKIKITAQSFEGEELGTSEELTIFYKPDNKNTISSNNNIVTDAIIANPNEKRVALVIGNSDYELSPLRNPVNDANTMAIELEKLGFKVSKINNGSQNQMKRAISDFGTELAKDKNTIGLFYYAGHGMQVKGKNYFVPIDAKIGKEPDVEVFCVELDGLLTNLEYAGNTMNLVILDACRNNPYSRSFRSAAGSGLATINAPSGTLIAFATAPGSTASDGEGTNGLYTQEFLKAIQTPKTKLEDVFKKVRTQVKTRSNGTQIPWENSSIEGDFYFKLN
jgi:hypothetical protein